MSERLLAFSAFGGRGNADCTKHCTKLEVLSVGDGRRGGGLRQLEDLAFQELDAELGDLFAEQRPGQRRVDVHDVAARSVRDDLQDVAPSAVRSRQRDEAAPQIVLTAAPKLDPCAILVKALERVVDAAVVAQA